MTTESEALKALEAAKCQRRVAEVAAKVTAGELSEAGGSALLERLAVEVPRQNDLLRNLYDEHNDAIDVMIAEAIAAETPVVLPWYRIDYRGASLAKVQERQLIYGEGGNTPGQVRWGDGSRDGRYRAPFFDDRGMVFRVEPAFDKNGVRHLTGRGTPAWWGGYARLQGPPRYFAASVRCRFDLRPGVGPAPIWAGHRPVEQDVEVFEREDGTSRRYPHNVVRFALHATFDGGSQTINVNNQKGLRYLHEVDDLEDWHTWTIRQEPDNAGGTVWSWDVDGERRQTVESAELERLWGKTMNVSTRTGAATVDISNNIGANIDKGAGYAWGATTAATTGAEQVTEWFEIVDLTPKAA